jgi:site-specific DNA-methyltransferase (adenine-specific)
MPENLLYYGDNLEILGRYLADESVDLVYLDPPFKSDQDYNVLFAEQDGSRHPRLQLRTVGELMAGQGLDYPRYAENLTFKKAPKAQRSGPVNGNLF